jgi:hypothetical protein
MSQQPIRPRFAEETAKTQRPAGRQILAAMDLSRRFEASDYLDTSLVTVPEYAQGPLEVTKVFCTIDGLSDELREVHAGAW